MQRRMIITFIVLNILNLHLFAFSGFAQPLQNSSEELYAVEHTHEHHHLDHTAEHKHGHSHKINLVDFFAVDITDVIVTFYKGEKYFVVKQCYFDPLSNTLFRPPIA